MIEHGLFKIGHAGWHIGEGVGFCTQTGDKYFHEYIPWQKIMLNLSLLVPKSGSY